MNSFFAKLWQSWRKSPKHQKVAQGSRRAGGNGRPGFLPALEVLEDRTLMTAGALDPTFGVGGKVITHIPNFDNDPGLISAQAIQPDGKIVVVGSTGFNFYGRHGALVRYNIDGSTDNSFGYLGTDYLESDGGRVAVQADGKILAAGSNVVQRVQSNGQPDDSFGTDGRKGFGYGFYIAGMAPQPDGKIILAGSYGGAVILRLNNDGSFDNSFSGGEVSVGLSTPTSLAVQSDGMIVVAGTTVGGGFGVARLQTDGSADPSFGSGGEQTISFHSYLDVPRSVAVEPNGTIVVAGSSYNTSTLYNELAIARLNSDGSPDNSFGIGGKQLVASIASQDIQGLGRGAVVQADGKIVAVGGSYQPTVGHYNFAVARLNINGSMDNTFGSGGQQTIDFGSGAFPDGGVALQSDGKIVVAGQALGNFALVRLLGDPLYDILNLTNAAQTNQAGSTIPIRVELTSGSGQDVSAANITLTATGIASVTNPNDLMAAQTAGNSNPGDVFQLLGGKNLFYQFNLKTSKTLAAGNYLLYFTVTDDPTIYSVQFTVK